MTDDIEERNRRRREKWQENNVRRAALAANDWADKTESCAILFNISESSLWRGVKSGKYPKPIKLSKFVVRWSRAELRACVEKILAERWSISDESSSNRSGNAPAQTRAGE